MYQLLLPLLRFTATIAHAQSSDPGLKLPNPLGTGTTLPGLLEKIFSFAAFEVGIPLVIIFILLGAYQMIFSGGDSEKFTKGKNTLLFTIVGYAVLLLSYGIVDIVTSILKP